MNYFPLTKDQQEWKDRAVGIAERDIEPRAAHYDRGAAFPQESLNALRDAEDTIDAELSKHGKEHEFHMYPGCGHGFHCNARGSYRPESARDAWGKTIAWFDAHLKG